MYKVSDEYREQINKTRLHKIKGTIKPYSLNYELDITENLCGEISKYNQCMDNSETFGIGAVYQGELNFSLKTPLGFSADIYDAEVNLKFGLQLESSETEWIPLGVYYIREVEKSGQILQIKALDRMSELDIPTEIIEGQAYTFEQSMQEITFKTGVEFAQTFDEIIELSGIQLWQNYGFKSSGTYRDILREMAQLYSGFAYINRAGKIEFKRFDNTTPVAEIPANRRFSLKMSDFLFRVGKIQYKTTQGYTVIKTITGNGATVYFENNGLIMDSNQSQSERYENSWLDYELEKIADNLKNVKYTAGTIEYSGDPALDIGDYVQITGGDAEDELMLIGSDNWVFRGVQTLISPDCETAGGTSSGYSGSSSGSFSEASSLEYLKCESNSGFADNDLTVCKIDFKVLSYSTYVELSGQVLINAEEPTKLSISYLIDNNIEDFMSKIDVNGSMLINLNHIFNPENGDHNIKVVLSGNVQIEKSESYLKGQNIRLLDIKPTGSDDYIYMTENDGITLLYYIGKDKRIKIPDEIDGKPVRKIESMCFTNSDVTDVIISDSITEIY
ncbi:MAG: hypothetical protein K2G63_03415 [Oscillospiraceae bacterium]|nr:hypothetical protein [Oscillospiraceae bacterium]